MSIQFLRYVSAKQPMAKNTATNHATDLATQPTSPPILPPPLPPLSLLMPSCCCRCRHCRIPCCCCPCCHRCPCLSSLPSLPSSLLLASLTLSLSLPVVLTVLAGHPCRCCHRPCSHRPCCRCRPCPLLSPSSPVVVVVLAISSSFAFG